MGMRDLSRIVAVGNPLLRAARGRGTMRSMVEGASLDSVLVAAPSTSLRLVPLPRGFATGEDGARAEASSHAR